MSENNNQEQELDMNQLMKVRREKLQKLQEEGKNPFEITKFNKQFCFNLGGKYFIRRRRVKLIYPFASINTRFFTLKQFCLRKKSFFSDCVVFCPLPSEKATVFFRSSP